MAHRCVLDGATIGSEAMFYAALARGLAGMPGHFGGNLDALWDALTRDVAGPFTIEWRAAALSATALGARYEKLLAVLREAAAARRDFTLIVTD